VLENRVQTLPNKKGLINGECWAYGKLYFKSKRSKTKPLRYNMKDVRHITFEVHSVSFFCFYIPCRKVRSVPISWLCLSPQKEFLGVTNIFVCTGVFSHLQNKYIVLGFRVLTAVVMMSSAFWDKMPCSPLKNKPGKKPEWSRQQAL
jgi:hypothetical protein